MDIRPITERYAVSPQIEADELADIAAAGFVRVICNRPDQEVPPGLRSEAIGEAARKAGLEFEVLELTHQTMTPENVARQAALIDGADGPVLAYCASGTRCTVVWALGQGDKMEPDAILSKAREAGYDLEGLRPTLQKLHDAAG